MKPLLLTNLQIKEKLIHNYFTRQFLKPTDMASRHSLSAKGIAENSTRPKALFQPTLYLLVLSQQWKHQNNLQNLLKLAMKTPERRHRCQSGVFIFKF